jgi:hypothetical protein
MLWPVSVCRSSTPPAPQHPLPLTTPCPSTPLIPRAPGFGRAPKTPTRRVRPGICAESLALEVALACRVPPRVIQRAATLLTRMKSYRELGVDVHDAGEQQQPCDGDEQDQNACCAQPVAN